MGTQGPFGVRRTLWEPGGLLGSPVGLWEARRGPLGVREGVFEGRLVLWESGGPLGTGCGPLGGSGVLWEPGGLLGAWGNL
jgi:hypothetical protein